MAPFPILPKIPASIPYSIARVLTAMALVPMAVLFSFSCSESGSSSTDDDGTATTDDTDPDTGADSDSDADTDADSDSDADSDTGENPLPVFQYCTGTDFELLPATEWRNDVTATVVTTSGSPEHAAQDLIVRPGDLPTVVGLFTYGTVNLALADEEVHAFLDICGDTPLDLGTALTDASGYARFDTPSDLGPGVYEARLQVLGDESLVSSFVWVLPAGTRLVVTDIDGTMTTADTELFYQILVGSYLPEAYPGAAALTLSHAERHDIVVYLTGRPYWLQGKTRDWLRELGFAQGPLHVTDTADEVLPIDSGVGDFKKSWLLSLLDAGYVVELAYGNATTDIYAYLGAGLDPGAVWIIGDNAGLDGTNAVVDSWTPRADEVAAMPEEAQPFDMP